MITNWIGWMLSGIILILLIGIAALVKDPIRLVLTGKRAEGKVVQSDTLSKSYGPLGENILRATAFEFVTEKGRLIHIRSKDANNLKPLPNGETIQVAYDQLNPEDCQILRWKESPLIGVVALFGFIAVILMMQIVGISVSEDGSLDDPFHLLPKVIANFKTLPYLITGGILVLIIFVCIATTFTLSNATRALVSTGLKAQGIVDDMSDETSVLVSGGTGSGTFAFIKFKDKDNAEHTIKYSVAKPFSGLEIGDAVEVIYPAEYPDSAVVNNWMELYFVQYFFGICSLLMLLGVFFAIRSLMRA